MEKVFKTWVFIWKFVPRVFGISLLSEHLEMEKVFKSWVFIWKLFQECLEHHFCQNILEWKKCSKREFSNGNCSKGVWDITSFRTSWNGKSVQNVVFHMEIVPRVFGTSLLSEHLEVEKVFKAWVFIWKLFQECLEHHFFQNILKWKKCSKREFSCGNCSKSVWNITSFRTSWNGKGVQNVSFHVEIVPRVFGTSLLSEYLEMEKVFKTWVFIWKLFQECLGHHFFQNILKWKKCSKREFSYGISSKSVWDITSFRTSWNGKSVQNVSVQMEILPRVFGTSFFSEHLEMEKAFKTWFFIWKLFQECLEHHFFQNILKWKKCSKREFSFGNCSKSVWNIISFRTSWNGKSVQPWVFIWKFFQECLEHHFFQNILK